MLSVGARAAVVQPDAEAARAFGFHLQQEFTAKKSAVFYAAVYPEAFRRRVFHIDHAEERFPWADWPDIPPGLKETLASLDAFSVCVDFRVALDLDVRTLECDFVSENSVVQTVTLMLTKDPGGEIRIADARFGGDALTQSEFLRDSYLLQGVDLPDVRGEEELELGMLSHTEAAAYVHMLEKLSAGDYDDAYAAFRALSSDLRATRLGRQTLTALAMRSVAARIAVVDEIHSGSPVDPLFRLRVASFGDNPADTLAAFDAVMVDRANPSIYICLKAGVLLASGHATDAYRLARDVTLLEPLNGFAFITALRAAAVADDGSAEPRFTELLEEWSRWAPAAQIRTAVEAVPDLARLRSSAAYSNWKSRPVPPAQ